MRFGHTASKLLVSRFSSSVMTSPLPRVIGCCTDVEGNGRYWERYVSMSKVLSRNGEGKLVLAPDSAFVFNGDAVDKGSHDIRFTKELVALADRYPDRVTLILGNRDLNKMRLSQELNPEHIARVPLSEHPGVYWRRDVAASLASTPGITMDARGVVENTASNRLKWILANTMGAATTFELRRKELEECGESSSDDDVVRSFVKSVGVDGCMTDLMKRGQLVKVIGDTLFLHGGIDESVLGWVPGDGEGKGDSVHSWAQRLNAFCRRSVASWCAAMSSGHPPIKCWAYEGGYDESDGAGMLMQYGMGWLPGMQRNKTVVYRDWLNESNSDIQRPSSISGYGNGDT